MQFYKTTYTLNGHQKAAWSKSAGDATKDRARLKLSREAENILTVPTDVPTNQKDLLEFLNASCN